MALRSSLGSFNWNDALHGAFMAVLGAVVELLIRLAGSPDFDITKVDWKMVANGALVAVLAYIAKKFSTNSEGKILTREPEKSDTDNP